MADICSSSKVNESTVRPSLCIFFFFFFFCVSFNLPGGSKWGCRKYARGEFSRNIIGMETLCASVSQMSDANYVAVISWPAARLGRFIFAFYFSKAQRATREQCSRALLEGDYSLIARRHYSA